MIETKELGKSGIKLPVIGMGTWGIGGEFNADYTSDTEAVRILRAGVDLGLNFIDTAERYGAGHSEELVGKAVKGIRGRVFIASKVSPENLTYSSVLEAADRSLKRIATDYIDLYLVHIPNPQIPVEQWTGAMEKLVEQGKVRLVGVSNFSVKQIVEAQSILKYPLVCDEVEYNLATRRVERNLLPFVEREGMTIIAYRPLAKGVLASHSMKSAETLNRMALKYRKSVAQVCLNWLIAKEPVIAIPMTAKLSHLEENIGAAGWRMEPEDYYALDRLTFDQEQKMTP